MNFFQHQEKARKRTGLLIALFTLAVACLVAVTVLSVSAIFYTMQQSMGISIGSFTDTMRMRSYSEFVFSELSLFFALMVVFTVIVASIYKWTQMSGGGKTVAEALGGRRISPDSTNAMERKVLNIVEEMAIASGTPVPPVYVLDDTSINAFAAGHTRHDTVIGVTKGCITLLNRDELQGVMAHEFSHIHNGDMRLNMRLISVLHGILAITAIGYAFSRSHSSGSRSKGNQAAVVGITLIAIGYIGTFFGNIIKAAVSRQREYLADASAVQFTRNPSGISGALKKIGGLHHGSRISSNAAFEFSHLYFGQGIHTQLNAVMATHPPIVERIKRIEPRWDGSYENPEECKTNIDSPLEKAPDINEVQQQTSFSDQAVNFIGEPQPHHRQAAEILLSALPHTMREQARNSYCAQGLIFALLIDEDTIVKTRQFEALLENTNDATLQETKRALEHIQALPRALYLTLIDLCLPAIKNFSASQFFTFKNTAVALTHADQKISLFEWSLYRIIINHYENPILKPLYKLDDLNDEISTLFSMIVYSGANNAPGNAFKIGIDTLGVGNRRFTLSDEPIDLKTFDQALTKLSQLKPLQKPRILKAIAAIIAADGVVKIEEAELYRAIGDTLGCPIPPIVV